MTSNVALMTNTVFAQIVQREIPADIFFEDEHCIVIHDIQPQAPVHLLVISKKPIESLMKAEAEDLFLLGHMNLVAAKVASMAGCSEGFRLVANSGSASGQTVFHLHFHVLGQKHLPEQNL